ncbi:hypothetical protein ALC56_10813 [Trachymyrmex septentrionalis]|uniref:Uncharacterized protein n=1 Tax=Trachymyrmex septentrionalis TaxID=34720 RepID=A0A195F2P6_9HYME|nr:hypothetical protein ALC56_10813 [Trachymyrmex septentrionalis]
MGDRLEVVWDGRDARKRLVAGTSSEVPTTSDDRTEEGNSAAATKSDVILEAFVPHDDVYRHKPKPRQRGVSSEFVGLEPAAREC